MYILREDITNTILVVPAAIGGLKKVALAEGTAYPIITQAEIKRLKKYKPKQFEQFFVKEEKQEE